MLSWGGRDMIEEELFPFVSPGGPSNWPRFPGSFRLSVATDDSQCEAGPTGDPNNLKPPLVTGISGGKAMLEREESAGA